MHGNSYDIAWYNFDNFDNSSLFIPRDRLASPADFEKLLLGCFGLVNQNLFKKLGGKIRKKINLNLHFPTIDGFPERKWMHRKRRYLKTGWVSIFLNVLIEF